MSSTNDDLQRRMQRLLDKQDIYEVVARYCRGVDRCDVELIRSAFHEDAYDDHGYYRGDTPWEFAAKLVRPRHLRMSTQQEDIAQENPESNPYIAAHYLHNVLIEFDSEDVAHAESYCIAVNGHHDKPELGIAGARYADRMEKRGGEWRIAHRIVIFDWTGACPSTVKSASREFVWGRRDCEDLTYQRPLTLRRDQK